MKKKKIGIIVGIAILLIISIIIGILLQKKEEVTPEKPKYKEGTFYFLKTDNNLEDINNKLITTKEEFEEIFTDNQSDKYDFDHYNYALFVVLQNSCGERNITPTGYLENKDKLIIHIKYEATCGVCAPEELYYLLQIDKSITKKEIELTYEATNNPHCDPNVAYKPIIYIYPDEDKHINIKLGHEELLKITYPTYKNGWDIDVKQDGTIIDKNEREYYSLFWEGKNHQATRKEEGFIVSKEETKEFLEKKLDILGLNNKEAEEFIIYWLPILEESNYNYIYFETEQEINQYMPLIITPNPDTIIRIQMDYQPLIKQEYVKEQKLTKKVRSGYSVVEWGGSLITK